MKFRGIILLVAAVTVSACCFGQAAAPPTAVASAPQATAQGFEISGVVKSGSTPLPGVAVTAAHSLTGKKVSTSTDLDGSYRLAIPNKGKWVVRAELSGFAAQTSEIKLDPAAPTQKIDLAMTLLSRVPKPEDGSAVAGMQGTGNVLTSGKGVERLSLSGDQAALNAAGGQGGSDAPLAGANALASSADAGNESIAVNGQMGNSQDFGLRNMDDLRDKIQELRSQGRLNDMGGGGPGGGLIMMLPGGGGGGGRGGFRGFNINRPHGAIFYNAGNSALDAAPFPLSGNGNLKPEYSSNRFGGLVGGPLNIPHIYNGGLKTFFVVNYTGNRSGQPYDVFSHVPTLLERGGDFSQSVYTSGPNAGMPVQLYDPSTNASLGSSIPAGMISAQALALLNYIPKPNQPGQQNFRFTTTQNAISDAGSIRLIHNFGAAVMGPGGARGAGGGGAGRGRAHNSLNVGVNFQRNHSDLLQPFPGLGGASNTEGWNVSGGWNIGNRRITSSLRLTWNVNKISVANTFNGITNVAALAGINGVSTNPLDWGMPTLSFANYSGLSGVSPSRRRDQTFSLGETVMLPRKKHNIRLGGDWRTLNTATRSNSNANGSFIFTGYATAQQNAGVAVPGTGYDFADFLLGEAQQTSLQYSPNTFHFQDYSYDAFAQDDWRARNNVTINLGMRYEYIGPYTETNGQLANLLIAPGFTAVTPVQASASGSLPRSLVRPDRNNFAPRIGIAYRLKDKTVIRAGYGINYNLGQYSSIVQNLALQPPFSFTQTNIATYANPLTMANGFPAPGASVLTNNYAVDPNYHLGYVQLWNLGVQRELKGGMQLVVSYQGSKGTALDIVEAPNRTATGLLIPTVQPYLYETAAGSSILHSGSLRLRKRMKKGFSIGGTYVYSKSIDNASSIGGGGGIVAQNAFDLAAERGLSSFDQRHKLQGDWLFELPFGSGKKWLNGSGFAAKALGDWTLSGNFTVASGTPFTAHILGSVADVARGSNGSLRADYNGAPIQIGDRTLSHWFNTAAFSVPLPGTFGNAGRDTIIGPGTIGLDFNVNKNIPIKDMMSLEFSAQATNFLNHVNLTGIDTVVNSPTFGQVVGVGSMRKISMSTRFRF